jgi:hypothetical protein
MPRITIDIEGFGVAALSQPEAGAIAPGPSQPRANAPAASPELLARAQAEGALNAGPAPSPPAGPGSPPTPFSSSGATQPEAGGVTAGPAPESVFRNA